MPVKTDRKIFVTPDAQCSLLTTENYRIWHHQFQNLLNSIDAGDIVRGIELEPLYPGTTGESLSAATPSSSTASASTVGIAVPAVAAVPTAAEIEEYKEQKKLWHSRYRRSAAWMFSAMSEEVQASFVHFIGDPIRLWAELKSRFDVLHDSRSNAYIREEFYSLSMHSDEHISTWINRVREFPVRLLGSGTEITDTETAIKLLGGLPASWSSQRDIIFLKGDLSLNTVVGQLRLMGASIPLTTSDGSGTGKALAHTQNLHRRRGHRGRGARRRGGRGGRGGSRGGKPYSRPEGKILGKDDCFN